MSAYSAKAQPFLDAIANAVFASSEVRNWLITGTRFQDIYPDAEVLIEEQRQVRWAKKPTKQPFWANYLCGKDSRCTCRIEGSKGLESDAIFFFRNRARRTLAVHVEFKHRRESFGYGQPEAYPLRAECFSKTYVTRATLNAHQDWTTVLFCDEGSLSDPRLVNFEKVISHGEARRMIPAFPAAL